MLFGIGSAFPRIIYLKKEGKHVLRNEFPGNVTMGTAISENKIAPTNDVHAKIYTAGEYKKNMDANTVIF